MALDLTEVLAAAADIERTLLKPDNSTCVLLKAGATLATLTAGFDWESVDMRATQRGQKFTVLTVYVTDDVANLSQHLRQMDAVTINGRNYKIVDKTEPEEATREWRIELQPTGK